MHLRGLNHTLQAQFEKVGSELQAQQLEQVGFLLEIVENEWKLTSHQLKSQMTTFKENLEEYARKYKKDIRQDPAFRSHFQKMCQSIGVDPLASNKGFWSELLGVGDFYYELGVQIIEICLATRERNGGLMDIIEVKQNVERMRGKNAQAISEDDIVRSIKNLKPLGSGFELVTIGSRKMVQSVPRELNADFSLVLSIAQTKGYTTATELVESQGWEEGRATNALDSLLKEGICWIDLQVQPPQYWVAGFFVA
ncbi:ESCRT-II subunit protein snf8 [Dinochytrium kinnereticum]|nr:ESCRT-II subunit protein snf8 [Dinochytrium kinnereticum]